MPLLKRNIVRRNGSASAFTAGAAFTKIEQRGRREVSDGRHHEQRKADRSNECLVDSAVHLVMVAGAGEARNENTHSSEE